MPTCTCPQLNDRRLIRGVGRDEFKKNFDLRDIVRQVVREVVLIRARCGYFGVVRPTTRVLDAVLVDTAVDIDGTLAHVLAERGWRVNAAVDAPANAGAASVPVGELQPAFFLADGWVLKNAPDRGISTFLLRISRVHSVEDNAS